MVQSHEQADALSEIARLCRDRSWAFATWDVDRGLQVAGRVEPGLYVAGWIKRGATGFIGTNKSCSEETVASLLDDLAAGLLTEPDADAAELERWLTERAPDHLGLAGWQALDVEERRRGAEQGRPRVKILDVEEMRAVATAGLSRPRGRRPLRFGT